MLRHVAYAALLVGFAVVAVEGVAGWTRARTPPPESESTETDETPLSFRHLNHDEMHREASKGYPWPLLHEYVPLVKRDLPPDLGNPGYDDARSAVSSTLASLRFEMPEGRLLWSDVLDALRARFEPQGVKVLAGPESMRPPSSFCLEFPRQRWTGIQVVSWMYDASQRIVGYQVCADGVCVGTNDAVNYEMRESLLGADRRRVAAEHAAPALDVEFRPDFVDATVGALANVVQAQTGVELVADPELWDTGACLRWRGGPRKLRDALDQIAKGLHCYWRYRDGRVWLLRP